MSFNPDGPLTPPLQKPDGETTSVSDDVSVDETTTTVVPGSEVTEEVKTTVEYKTDEPGGPPTQGFDDETTINAYPTDEPGGPPTQDPLAEATTAMSFNPDGPPTPPLQKPDGETTSVSDDVSVDETTTTVVPGSEVTEEVKTTVEYKTDE